MLDTTPLFPCLPAILSPTAIFLFMAIYTLTIFITPGGSSSPLLSLSILSSNTTFIRSACSLKLSTTFFSSFSIRSSPTDISSHLLTGILSSISSVMVDPFFKMAFPFLSVSLAARCFPRRSFLIFLWKLSFTILISSSLSFKSLATSLSSMDLLLSSLSVPLREKTLTSIITPSTPGGTFREVSFTSSAFSPNMARRSFSSGESCVSPLGVTLPTSISPGTTSAPIRTIPLSSRSLSASSPTFGISLVISSLPSFISLAITSNSSICTDVNTSSLTRRSFISMESSKL